MPTPQTFQTFQVVILDWHNMRPSQAGIISTHTSFDEAVKAANDYICENVKMDEFWFTSLVRIAATVAGVTRIYSPRLKGSYWQEGPPASPADFFYNGLRHDTNITWQSRH